MGVAVYAKPPTSRAICAFMGRVIIEANAMQQIYTDVMRRMTDIPVKEFVTTAVNKYPLDKGVPGLRIVLETVLSMSMTNE